MIATGIRSDLELCTAARAGSGEAEGLMLKRYGPIILKTVAGTRILGLTEGDIESEASIALLKAIRAENWGKATTFGVFARRCVHNHVASLVRATRARPVLLQHVDPEADACPCPSREESITDRQALTSYDCVFTDDMIAKVRAVLTEPENRVLSKMLARAGVIDAAEHDQGWKAVAAEMGCFRTGVWRIVMEIRRKAEGVLN